MSDAKRDANFVPSALGVSSSDSTTTLPLQVDPITGRLLVDQVGAVTSITASTGILLTPNPITTTGTVGLSTALAPIATLTGNSLKVLRVNSGETAVEYATISSGLTIGATAITSGTTTRILYDNAGVLGEYTLTGTGTVVTMQTAPTILGHPTIEGVTSTGATGTGNLVFASSPTLTTAVLGSSTATTQTPADNSTKIATTAYVDNAVLGQRQKEAVKYASVAPLPTIVYANGSSGVGATITGFAFGALSLDGSTPSVADRVLIKNQASDFQNGIYVVTAVGSGAAFLVLTRATDFDQASDIQTGDTVFVTAGNTLANTTWTYNGIDNPTMGTTSLTFVQAAGPGSYTAGNGIAITGVSIAINTSVTVDKTTAQTLTNKTITDSTNVLGGVTMTLGSDASGDTYYRNSSGVLTRIAAGANGTLLRMGASSVPAFTTATYPATAGTSGNVLTSDGTNWTSSAPAASSSNVNTFSTDYPLAGLYNVATTGSGANTFGTTNVGGLNMTTGGSGSSSVSWEWQNNSHLNLFAKSSRIGFAFYLDNIGTDFDFFVGAGNVTTATAALTFTPNHYGFKLIRSSSGTISLFGTQANGTTETATTALTTVVASDFVEVLAVFTLSTNVTYYYSINGAAWSAGTAATTNLPSNSSSGFNQGAAVVALSSHNVATTTQIDIKCATVVR